MCRSQESGGETSSDLLATRYPLLATFAFIEERLEKQLNAGQGRLDTMFQAVPAGDNASTAELRARIQALQSWTSRGRSFVPVMKTFLKLT